MPSLNKFVVLALLTLTLSAHAGVYDDLMVAANNNETERVLDFLNRGMDVNTTDMEGTSLAMIAARTNNHKLLEFLLRNRVNLLKRNKYGDDALMLSAYNGDLEAVKMLMAAGAQIQHEGWTALHYAAYQGHADVAAYLLEKGANVNALATNRQTALMLAARYGHKDVAVLLKTKQADLAAKDPQGKTAQDWAMESGNTDLAKDLALPPSVE